MSGIRVDTDVVMTARDGVVLRTDVYRHDDDLARPALLHRTPYDKGNPTLVSAIVADPLALARAGYAVVVQDVRGTFASGGRLDFGEQEHDDGYDAVEWVAAQPWCTGDVGVYGSSYHAITTYAALAAAPPHLRAALVMIGAADLATTVRPGGLFELGFLTRYSLGQVLDQVRRSDRSPEEKAALTGRVLHALTRLPETVAGTPVAEVDVLADPDLAPWWRDWTSDESGGYVSRSLARDQPLPDVPLLTVVGWRDFMQESMLTAFARRTPGPTHRLLAGPWAHGGAYTGHVGARSYPAAGGGVGTWQPVVRGWFDHWLRGSEQHPVPALLDGDPVRYFVSGDDRWVGAQTWPPPHDDRDCWLGTDGLLRPEPGTGTTAYRHDPHDPVPTTGGALTAPPLGPDGIQDQRPRQSRSDVAVWTTEPLDVPVTVAGAPRLVVELSSTAEDTDVVVTLGDVEPDGYVVNVAEGALRARSRSGGTDHWLVPGEPTVLEVVLHHTAHTFRAGHRICVDVAGSSYPRFSRNLGTRVVPEQGRLADAVASDQVVRHAGSRLVLPVVR